MINANIRYENSRVIVNIEEEQIVFEIDSTVSIERDRQDFAVWLLLPIAMKQNKALRINGKGTRTTIQNAKKLSQIWSTWMPGHFYDVEVSFDTVVSSEELKLEYKEDNICFYSGGVDSTYSIANKAMKDNNKLSLLTVHGMEYAFDDIEKFDYFIEKTKPFTNEYANNRILIKTNVYRIYNKYKINTKQSHITHIFTLAAAGFLYSGYSKHLIIAADYRLDQQFMVFPWGSNSATNYLFDDGITSLITEGDMVTRSEKLPYFMGYDVMLQSLTFCVDKKSRPNNCGVCSKCMRTKLMFFASTGTIPKIFIDMEINKSAFTSFNIKKKSEQAFISDLYYCAVNNKNIDKLPQLEILMQKIKNNQKKSFLNFFKIV
jgi:hypothetical protein